MVNRTHMVRRGHMFLSLLSCLRVLLLSAEWGILYRRGYGMHHQSLLVHLNFRWYKTSVGVMVLCEFELSVYTLYLQHLLVSQQTNLIVPISIALLVVLLGSVAVVTWRGVRP